jgi:predicted TIM-barrel fold metal-dependent hydrolase
MTSPSIPEESLQESLMRRRTFLASLAAGATAALSSSAFGASPRMKLYDTHAHFYSNDFEHYPLRADVAPAVLAKARTHPMTVEAMLGMWRQAGVELGCGVQYNTTYATDNRYLLDVAAAHPDRIRPVVILGPTDPATPAALGRMAKDNGICGVRFAGPPDETSNFPFLTEAARGAWEAADSLGLVVVLMPYRSHLPEAMSRIGALATRYSNVTIVLDHIGFPTPAPGPNFGFSPAHLALAAHGNVYYKYTSLLIEQLQAGGVSPREFLKFAVGIYGADHFVWGSDIGNTEGDYAHLVQMALDSADGLTRAQQRAIFHDTAQKLFVPGGRGRA